MPVPLRRLGVAEHSVPIHRMTLLAPRLNEVVDGCAAAVRADRWTVVPTGLLENCRCLVIVEGNNLAQRLGGEQECWVNDDLTSALIFTFRRHIN